MAERKKVLLVYPNFRPYMSDKWLPTNLIYLASTLIWRGYEPVLIDDRFDRERTLSIIEDNIDETLLVGISTVTGSQLRSAIDIAWHIKSLPDYVPIVFGGAFPSAMPDLLADQSLLVDYVVEGQGEFALTYLCDLIRLGVPPKMSVLSPKPVNISNLQPLPYFNSFINVADYLNPETMAINYATSTGCVGDCGFCYWHESYKYSRLLVDTVLFDLGMLKAIYGIRNINFDDGTFFVGRDRIMKLVDGFSKLNVSWRANARVDTLKPFTQKDWNEISRSGCHLIHIGLEHGSKRILDMMNKRIKAEDCLDLINKARLSGIQLRFHILLGNPTETVSDLERTGQLLSIMLDKDPKLDYTVNWFTPYPGCAMTEIAKQHGYEEPVTLEGFMDLELVNYVNLPKDDREIIKETSPWQTDYIVPWFTEEENAQYMEVFRQQFPEVLNMETTGQKVESIYS